MSSKKSPKIPNQNVKAKPAAAAPPSSPESVKIDQSNPLWGAIKAADQAVAMAKVAFSDEMVKAYNTLVVPKQESLNTILHELAKSSNIDFANQKWRLNLTEGVFTRLE